MKIHIIPVGLLGTNCYIVESSEKNAAIIDPGDQGKELTSILEELNLTPKMILLTHGHYDHIGGIADIRGNYPNIPIYIGPEEDFLIRANSGSRGNKKAYESSEIVVADKQVVEDGEEIKLDDIVFKVMYTPGHSSGGVIYTTGEHMFSGDIIFREEIGRCDLPTGDYKVMLETLRKIKKLPGDYAIYPGHGEKSSLEHERVYNPYMKDLA